MCYFHFILLTFVCKFLFSEYIKKKKIIIITSFFREIIQLSENICICDEKYCEQEGYFKYTEYVSQRVTVSLILKNYDSFTMLYETQVRSLNIFGLDQKKFIPVVTSKLLSEIQLAITRQFGKNVCNVILVLEAFEKELEARENVALSENTSEIVLVLHSSFDTKK